MVCQACKEGGYTKEIIRGKLCDTETSEHICQMTSPNGYGLIDLYKTKSGKFFNTYRDRQCQ